MIIKKKQEKTIIKLIDFGLSYMYSIYSMVNENCGTLLYMAPEIAAK